MLGAASVALPYHLSLPFARKTKLRNSVGRGDPNDKATTWLPKVPTLVSYSLAGNYLTLPKSPRHWRFQTFPHPLQFQPLSPTDIIAFTQKNMSL